MVTISSKPSVLGKPAPKIVKMWKIFKVWAFWTTLLKLWRRNLKAEEKNDFINFPIANRYSLTNTLMIRSYVCFFVLKYWVLNPQIIVDVSFLLVFSTSWNQILYLFLFSIIMSPILFSNYFVALTDFSFRLSKRRRNCLYKWNLKWSNNCHLMSAFETFQSWINIKTERNYETDFT